MKTLVRPKFKHDCEACNFVGRLDGKDCYVHVNNWTAGVANTLITRFGDDGPDYVSRTFGLGTLTKAKPGAVPEPYSIIWRMYDAGS